MISILLPTRQRVDLLERWFEMLEEVTSDYSHVEVLVKVDNDDDATRLFLKGHQSPFHVAAVPMDRGRGFMDMPRYNNTLAGYAAGEWMMMASDDTNIITTGWDKMIKGDPHVGMCNIFYDYKGWHDDVNPVYIHRLWYDTLGYISPEDCVFNDGWVATVSHRLGWQKRVPIDLYRDARDLHDPELSQRHEVDHLLPTLENPYALKEEDYHALLDIR